MLGLNRYSVRVDDSDPAWVSEYEKTAALIRSVTPNIELQLQHVGSTSIPGLAAKPIIDVGILLTHRDSFEDLCAALTSIGLIYRGDKGPPGELFIREPERDFRTHHIHVYFAGDPNWEKCLTFRDRLRASAQLRDEYESLKRKLAAQHRDDRMAYTDAKTEFVNRVLSDH